MKKEKKPQKKNKDKIQRINVSPVIEEKKSGRNINSLLSKLEETNINLDYSNVLISAMGQWLSISALSVIEDIFEDGIIGPGKISDDMCNTLDMMFKNFKTIKKEKYYLPDKIYTKEIPEEEILTLVEDLRKKGCRFFENLVFSIFEKPTELSIEEVVKRFKSGVSVKDVDIVTIDGHSHTLFDIEDLESIDKYGLPKREKEFLEDKVLSQLKEYMVIEPDEESKKIIDTFGGDSSIGEYLDRGGTLILKRPDKLEELRTREQLWEIEPSLMEENKKEFLGKPNYTNLVNKKSG